MAHLAFEQATVSSDSHGTSDDCEGGNTTTSPDRQTSLNKCCVAPSDHRDPGSEASSPVASRTRMRRKTASGGEICLEDGGDHVEDVDHEAATGATDVVATHKDL